MTEYDGEAIGEFPVCAERIRFELLEEVCLRWLGFGGLGHSVPDLGRSVESGAWACRCALCNSSLRGCMYNVGRSTWGWLTR